MKARLRIFVVAAAALLAAGTPALAQETTAPPAQNDVIGPPQLQDFSLNGTVTRPSSSPAPVQQAPRQATTRAASEQASQAETSRSQQPTRSAQADSQRERPAATASRSASADLPPPTPARRVTSPPVSTSSDSAALSPQPAFVPAPSESELNTSRNSLPMLPWLIAALALAGAAAWYFLRQRPRESYAGAGGIDLFEAPSPAPAPQPVRSPPPAAAPKPPSSGIVSTRLRPWLEIEFTPQRAVVDNEKAAIAFELTVFNSGSAPARDVLLEASLFNAGPMQDQQIRMFFDNPVAKGEKIPVIGPMQRISVNTAVFLARDQVRPIEVEGRQLFVPMIAFNALYGWGSGEGQTSASYLVGKTTKTDKLAPFRLDLGPRVSRTLDSREHEIRLRK